MALLAISARSRHGEGNSGARPPASPMSSHIVLLHGLGRTALSMSPVAGEAAKQGYSVLTLGYPSRTARVADLAEHVAHAVQQFAPTAPALDFVTHSLGGILLRAAVGAGLIPLERVRRAVLLAPPNQGSEAADFMPRFPTGKHADADPGRWHSTMQCVTSLG